MVVVLDPACLVCGGSGDPPCTAHAMLAPLVSEGTTISEASCGLEARRAATSGWSMAPDPSYLSSSGGLKLQFYKVEVQLSCAELRLVALDCHRMVDKRRHPVAFHCCRSTAVAPRSTASLLSLHASLLQTTQKEMMN